MPAPGALLPSSLSLLWNGIELEEGTDYLLDRRWGTLGVAPGSRVTPDATVEATYSYTLLRLDSVARDGAGSMRYSRGHPELTTARPAPQEPGLEVVANILVREGDDGPEVDVFPLFGTYVATATTADALPNTTGKLQRGEPTKIVCWGDSITFGGDASPGNRYVDVFARGLTAAYPAAALSIDAVAVGGSSSVHWILPEEYQHPIPEWQARCDWRLIDDAEPDLVCIEFVNDCGVPLEVLARTYSEVLRRIGRHGSEIVLVTPSFTEMHMMGFESLRDEDRRPYVGFLHQLAAEHGLALADASGRWGNLWRDGLPYITLLNNGINHPDDRGHLLIAEELLRCAGISGVPRRLE